MSLETCSPETAKLTARASVRTHAFRGVRAALALTRRIAGQLRLTALAYLNGGIGFARRVQCGSGKASEVSGSVKQSLSY